MVEHLKLISLLGLLFAGVWFAFYLKQIYKSFPYGFIKAILTYNIVFVFLNGLQLVILYSKEYLDLNGFADYLECMIFVFCMGMLFLFYLMLNILFSFRDRPIPRKYNRWVIAFAGFLIISNVFRTFIPETQKLFSWINIIRYNFNLISNLAYYLEFGTLIIFYFVWAKTKLECERIKISKVYTLSFIIADGITIIMVYLFQKLQVAETYRGIIVVVINSMPIVIPFLWTKFVFMDYAQRISTLIKEEDKLNTIYNKYKISKGETEVIELLIDGKSTNEIKEHLFLSYHTVKNHISHIYEKLNVRTRHELIHFFVKIK
ncbi:MAG: helix-turn-helix transcriptional regulator [Saprospiraceae bacterium]|nr:helix-turn-helix transcriptional regulator [Saprospiraceae bacterium]